MDSGARGRAISVRWKNQTVRVPWDHDCVLSDVLDHMREASASGDWRPVQPIPPDNSTLVACICHGDTRIHLHADDALPDRFFLEATEDRKASKKRRHRLEDDVSMSSQNAPILVLVDRNDDDDESHAISKDSKDIKDIPSLQDSISACVDDILEAFECAHVDMSRLTESATEAVLQVETRAIQPASWMTRPGGIWGHRAHEILDRVVTLCGLDDDDDSANESPERILPEAFWETLAAPALSSVLFHVKAVHKAFATLEPGCHGMDRSVLPDVSSLVRIVHTMESRSRLANLAMSLKTSSTLHQALLTNEILHLTDEILMFASDCGSYASCASSYHLLLVDGLVATARTLFAALVWKSTTTTSATSANYSEACDSMTNVLKRATYIEDAFLTKTCTCQDCKEETQRRDGLPNELPMTPPRSPPPPHFRTHTTNTTQTGGPPLPINRHVVPSTPLPSHRFEWSNNDEGEEWDEGNGESGVDASATATTAAAAADGGESQITFSSDADFSTFVTMLLMNEMYNTNHQSNLETTATRTTSHLWRSILGRDRGPVSISIGFEIADVLTLEIDRSDLLVSSYNSIFGLDDADLADWAQSKVTQISVAFTGESGYGDGVIRDWITSLINALCDPVAGIFVQVQPRVLHPAPSYHPLDLRLAAVAPHERWVRLAGVAFALAVRLEMKTGWHLSDAFAAMAFGRRSEIDRDCLDQLDPAVARSVRAVATCPTSTDLDAMACTFSYGEQSLFKGSEAVPVVMDNRALFAWMMAGRIAGSDDRESYEMVAAQAFRKGYVLATVGSNEANERDLVRSLKRSTAGAFNAQVGGALLLPAADILSRVKTLGSEGVSEAVVDAVSEAFRDHVTHKMDDERRRCLLRFWTGSDGMPSSFNGSPDAAVLQLLITRPGVDAPRRLPSSHTCYYQLCLPVAPTLEETLRGLDDALDNGSGGPLVD